MFSQGGLVEGRYTFPHSTIGAIGWHPRGAQLAIAGYNGIEIHNVLDPHSKPKRLKWRGSLLSLAWSPDGRVIAAGCQDNTVHFWRLREDRDSQMTGYEAKPRVLDWSPNGRGLATGGSIDLTLWPFAGSGPEGRAPVLLRRHRAIVSTLKFAPRGRLIASGCKDGQICIWDSVDDFAPPGLVMSLDTSVEDLAWHPDPQRLMLAGVTRHGTVSTFVIET